MFQHLGYTKFKIKYRREHLFSANCPCLSCYKINLIRTTERSECRVHSCFSEATTFMTPFKRIRDNTKFNTFSNMRTRFQAQISCLVFKFSVDKHQTLQGIVFNDTLTFLPTDRITTNIISSQSIAF